MSMHFYCFYWNVLRFSNIFPKECIDTTMYAPQNYTHSTNNFSIFLTYSPSAPSKSSP